MKNYIKLEIAAVSENESFARSAVATFISILDPNVEEISDIKTAVSEAVTNCIVHGYRDGIGTVYIHVKIFEGAKVVIIIRDKGCGIGDVKKAMEPLFTTCDNGERAGLGFSIMDSFMDKLKVRSVPGKGTVVTLEKSIVSKGK